MPKALEVLLHGLHVGYLRQGDHNVDFWMSDSYLRRDERPVLGQYFEVRLTGKRVFRGRGGALPGFFANLVPEPRSKIRRMLAEANGIDHRDDLAMLAVLGADMHGAVIVRPTEGGKAPPASSLIDPPPGGLRFSLPGHQLKFSMSRDDQKFALPAVGESGDWIVKITGSGFPQAAENEVATMRWARACGFSVPDCYVISTHELRTLPDLPNSVDSAYVVRRFDRLEDGGRVHQEDFAQVVAYQPEDKDGSTYNQLGGWVRTILGDDGANEYLRRVLFMIASGNGDAHLKNWSLLYPDHLSAVWTPLYDQVSTVAWGDNTLAMRLGNTMHWADLRVEFVEKLCRDLGVVEPAAFMAEALGSFLEVLQNQPDGFEMPKTHLDALHAHWRRVPVLRPHLGPS